MIATALLLIPVVAAILVPLLLAQPEWFALSVPLALIYGAAFYQAATRLISPVLLRRGPEILATTVREA
jgi:Kef-type K+ transport system membrane component KefB